MTAEKLPLPNLTILCKIKLFETVTNEMKTKCICALTTITMCEVSIIEMHKNGR